MPGTPRPSRSPVPAPPAALPQRGWRAAPLWLRLMVLAATGVGLASPLIVGAALRLTAGETVDVARTFLVDLRDGYSVADCLTPKARGEEDADAPGARPD